MMVPSRSTNTARDFELVEVMFEARDQLIAGDGRSAELADHDSAGMICNLRGFERRRVGSEREGKHRNRRVARARDIKYVPCFCRDVVRLFASLEKHHAVFAKRDQQILQAPSLE